MSFQSIPLDRFADEFGTTSTELSSVALNSQIVSVSDEFFAEAFHLLHVEPAPSLKGQFGPKGALFSGWESRRHNPAYDWCIIRLGAPSGHIIGFDIDTAHFSGNEAPQASVQALFAADGRVPVEKDQDWVEILPKVKLGPNARHLFKISPSEKTYTHVKLNMYPDGGIARFRVYGLVVPLFPNEETSIDLAYVLNGGRVVAVSDQHFGIGPNLLLPGRGKDMGDGWETKRSRGGDHTDWAIIKLGAPGLLEQAEIDTAHFKGNFPESCELHAVHAPLDDLPNSSAEWVQVLPRTKLGPHRRHFFQLENVERNIYTHVRVTIFPDGGIKRVRIIGRREKSLSTISSNSSIAASTAIETAETIPQSPLLSGITIPAVPLTYEAFHTGGFGDVIQAWRDPHSAPRGIKVTSANQGTANKFHALSRAVSLYPMDAVTGDTRISVFRSTPPVGEAGIEAKSGGLWPVKLLERHPFTNQIFIPMGTGHVGEDDGAEGDTLPKAGKAYLVVVAKNGSDDRPDLTTLRAFVASTSQGIAYGTGVWHHPMITLETTIDFTCVETQTDVPDNIQDCEIVQIEAADVVHVQIPSI